MPSPRVALVLAMLAPPPVLAMVAGCVAGGVEDREQVAAVESAGIDAVQRALVTAAGELEANVMRCRDRRFSDGRPLDYTSRGECYRAGWNGDVATGRGSGWRSASRAPLYAQAFAAVPRVAALVADGRPVDADATGLEVDARDPVLARAAVDVLAGQSAYGAAALAMCRTWLSIWLQTNHVAELVYGGPRALRPATVDTCDTVVAYVQTRLIVEAARGASRENADDARLAEAEHARFASLTTKVDDAFFAAAPAARVPFQRAVVATNTAALALCEGLSVLAAVQTNPSATREAVASAVRGCAVYEAQLFARTLAGLERTTAPLLSDWNRGRFGEGAFNVWNFWSEVEWDLLWDFGLRDSHE